MEFRYLMPPLDNSANPMGPTADSSALRRLKTNDEYKAVTEAVTAYTPPKTKTDFWKILKDFDPETRYDGFDVVPEGIYVRDDESGNPIRFEASGTIYLAFEGTGNPADTVEAEVKGRLFFDEDGKLRAKVTELNPLLPE